MIFQYIIELFRKMSGIWLDIMRECQTFMFLGGLCSRLTRFGKL